jgi:hypothetical protein
LGCVHICQSSDEHVGRYNPHGLPGHGNGEVNAVAARPDGSTAFVTGTSYVGPGSGKDRTTIATHGTPLCAACRQGVIAIARGPLRTVSVGSTVLVAVSIGTRLCKRSPSPT